MNTFRTAILLSALTALLLVIGRLIGGNSGLMIALVIAIILNMGAYWFSDKLVLSMYHAQEVTPAEAPTLYQIVRDLTEKAGLPMPKVYIVPTDTPNAFATGRNPENAAVAATTGILQMLTPEELTGVIAHELSHVYHRDTLISAISATIAGAIGMLANMAQWAMIFGFGRGEDNREGPGMVGTLLMAILAPITATLIQLAISRSREFQADESGAKLCGHPLWLASALQKLETANQRIPLQTAVANPATAHLFIVNPLSGTNLMQLFSTHPPLEERIARLQAMANVT